ncbi:MAG: nitroreductase family protein [Sphingobium sp.]|uniref:nitroreductase family protein n=1 Tax=Sphingobium sp. TaxID=1912891 RepID=UPI0029BC43EC|nr:nitroreductase family protein [Sphingobium sp.]MDX3909841.1 nitroreductase family protein [Sphingobium sp.]
MSRSPDHPINSMFFERWSPRSFTGEAIPDAVLQSAFEAARWAPSAMNAQPWRFLLARPGDEHWQTFIDVMMPRNRLWAAKASALVVILSERQLDRRDERVDNHSHSFDAGAAWANFAHQALLLGWHTHGIGGFDNDAARERLAVPDDFAIEAMIALGRQGGIEALHADFHVGEAPNGRRPLAETVFAGTLDVSAFAEEEEAA